MRRYEAQLSLQEHAILFLFPVLLIAFYSELARFKGDYLLDHINLPVYHTYDFGDILNENAAVIYADNNGLVSVDADYLSEQQPSFILPSNGFSLTEANANRVRTLQLQQYIFNIRCIHPRTTLLLYADGRLPYTYFRQLLSCICGIHHTDWCKMYWMVNWQP